MSYAFPRMTPADIRTADGARLVAASQVWEGRLPWSVNTDENPTKVHRGSLKRAYKAGITKGDVTTHGVVIGRVGTVRDAATATTVAAAHLPHTVGLDVALEAVAAIASVLSVKAKGYGATSEAVAEAVATGDPRKVRKVAALALSVKRDAIAAAKAAAAAEAEAKAKAEAEAETPETPEAETPEAETPEAPEAPQSDANLSQSVPTPPVAPPALDAADTDTLVAEVLDRLMILANRTISAEDHSAIRDAWLRQHVTDAETVAA